MTAHVLKKSSDFPFTLKEVKRERTGDPLSDAVVTWELLDEDGEPVIGASGSMSLYDPAGPHFEGLVGKAVTATLEDYREYSVVATVVHSGLEESFPLIVVAVPKHKRR